MLFGVFLCLIGVSAVSSTEVFTSLSIKNKDIAPDGFPRSAVLAGETYPGPLIQGNKASSFGDTFRISVKNELTDDTMRRSTSVHWHGLLQNRTTWADGTAGVSQCPIAPNHAFLYGFTASNQAGTFWYHAHQSTQYCDGLRGPFIVYDPYDPHKHLYDVDDESTILTLSDWFHTKAPDMGFSQPDSVLINGFGRYPGGPKVDLAVTNVDCGKRYRLRLISMSCAAAFTFSIDNHKMTIIEADGENTVPLTVDRLQIFPAQRYSVIIEANQPVGNYWIRSLPDIGNRNITSGFSEGINSAILRYKGAENIDPVTTESTCAGDILDETNLHPLTNPKAPGRPFIGGADVNINLALALDTSNQSNPLFTINGASFSPPTVPVLLQILSGARNAQDLLPNGSVYTLPKNQVIEITIPAIKNPHPFHLHGHTFSVIKSAGNNSQPNFDNPVRRDVVNIGETGSNVTIRFVTDNSGPYLFHCHIVAHLSAGLGIVFAEDPEETTARNPVPADWDQLCPIIDALPPSATAISLEPLITP